MRDVVVAVSRIVVVGLCLVFAVACEPAQASRGDGVQPLVTTVESLGIDADAATALIDDGHDDKGLRRSYGADVMKFHGCMKVADDGTLRGEACPSALVVFGPYISAPGNANVRFRFDIESEGQLTVMSDVLSDGAKQFHGAVDEQHVRPDEATTIQYRLHLFERASALETRIGIRVDAPASFTISRLALSIE
jgi:hypothetical protein